MQDVGEDGERAEVGVVALGLPGERRVQGVVDVVAPLRVQPVAAGLARRDQPRVVEVRLGDEGQRAAQVRRQRRHVLRHLLEQVGRPGVAQGVDGVEAQGVDAVVAQPHRDVVEDVAAHGVRPRPVEVQRRAPDVLAEEVGPEAVEVGPGRPEVVVDDVEHDAEPAGVAGVDEPPERHRPAVVLGDRVPEHAVVAPAPRAVEGVDRQDLDEVDAELDEVVQPLLRAGERAALGERADVHLVDHRPGQGPAGPGRVGRGGLDLDDAATGRARRAAASASAGRGAGRRRRGRTRSPSPARRRAR